MQECFLTKQQIFVRDGLFISFLKALCQVFTENVQPIFSSLSIRSVEFCPKINNINRNFSTNSEVILLLLQPIIQGHESKSSYTRLSKRKRKYGPRTKYYQGDFKNLC